MFNIRKNKKGFTLVELIVVIAILAILAGTAAGIGVTLINKNTNKTAQSEANNLVTDFKLFIQDKQSDDDFNLNTFADGNAIKTQLFEGAEGFIASLNEDKQQEGKLSSDSVVIGTLDVNAAKSTLADVGDKKLTAGKHEFYAYVSFTAAGTGTPATPATMTVTFACAAKGKFNNKEIISAIYTYADQVG